jgi:tetratricopeptide (TPR) repeat protein
MDWGLAKSLSQLPTPAEQQAGAAVASYVRTLRNVGTPSVVGAAAEDDWATQVGTVLGTPSYMPPEQAAGQVQLLDERCDVFGLGAILCEVLTGQPPYSAKEPWQVHYQAALGELRDCFERLDRCGADAELVVLVKDCLQANIQERPRDAAVVAARVAAHQQGVQERLRQAEQERAVAAARTAELRKRHRVQLALGAALGLLLVVGVAFGWWVWERQSRNAEAVAGLLDQCEKALRAGDAAAAAVPLEAAWKRSQESGVASQAAWLTRCQEDLAVLRDLDEVDQLRWTPVEHGKYPESAEVARRYHEALGRFGADPDAAGVEPTVARIAGSMVRDRLVEALDRLLRAEHSAAVRAALQGLDPDPFRDAVRDAERDNNAAVLVQLADQAEALQQQPGFAAFLGESKAISPQRQWQVLETAVRRRPSDLGLLMALGESYPVGQREGAEERARWFQAAVAAAPTNCAALSRLGIALADKGDLGGAIAELQQATRLDPKAAQHHCNLGTVLYVKGDLEGAISEYQQAIRLVPKFAPFHYKLGNALRDKGDLDRAISEYQQAIRLDPKLADPHNDLGIALKDKGDLEGAIAEYQQAIRLDPKDAQPHHGLGLALYAKKDLEGAIAEYQTAILLDPSLVWPHCDLIAALAQVGDAGRVTVALQETVRLQPLNPLFHYQLGCMLRDRGRTAEAEQALREAVRQDGNHHGAAIDALADLLTAGGSLDAAVGARQEIVRLDPTPASRQKLAHAERLRELLRRLPAVLTGKDKPKSPAEGCDFANLCSQPFQKRYAKAASLFAQAFAAEPKLAEDLSANHRYNATCCASLAGCGQGADKRDDKERARLRGQALQWLRADLVLWRRQAGSADAVQRQEAAARMKHWLGDSDLAGVRPGPGQVAMPPEERAGWQALWADIQATLAEASKPPPPGVGPGKK